MTDTCRKWITVEDNGNVIEVDEVADDGGLIRQYTVHSVHNSGRVVVYANVTAKGFKIDCMDEAKKLYHFIRDNLPAQTYEYVRDLFVEDKPIAKVK